MTSLLLTPRPEAHRKVGLAGEEGTDWTKSCVHMFNLNISHDNCRISRREAGRKISNSLVAKFEKSPLSQSNEAL